MMTNTTHEFELLTPVEKAAELKVSLSTLARWRGKQNTGQNTGPRFLKLGRGKASPIRYFRESL